MLEIEPTWLEGWRITCDLGKGPGGCEQVLHGDVPLRADEPAPIVVVMLSAGDRLCLRGSSDTGKVAAFTVRLFVLAV
jgi:hypothetical protein